MRRVTIVVAAVMVAAAVSACGGKKPPVARPVAPPAPASGGGADPGRPAGPPEPIRETPMPPEPVITSDPLLGKDIDEINKNSPFQPVFFLLDQADIDSVGQETLNKNAEVLKKYPGWVITIEGHADERGTAEYNLALGERRSLAARNYLVSLGISADRLRTISYGKEFPFDPAHTEGAWSKNRRAHFVVTSK
jgi:peptidoglycan-associated lipoprotein